MANLSIKNVPEELQARLKAQAKLHHRSLQGELMTILEEAVHFKRMTAGEIYKQVKILGVATGPDSGEMIREDRDAR